MKSFHACYIKLSTISLFALKKEDKTFNSTISFNNILGYKGV